MFLWAKRRSAFARANSSRRSIHINTPSKVSAIWRGRRGGRASASGRMRTDCSASITSAENPRSFMVETIPAVPLLSAASQADKAFPTLTAAQVSRIGTRGRARKVEQGEVLTEACERSPRFFVVTAGRLEVVRPSGTGEELVAIHRPGQFSGELS